MFNPNLYGEQKNKNIYSVNKLNLPKKKHTMERRVIGMNVELMTNLMKEKYIIKLIEDGIIFFVFVIVILCTNYCQSKQHVWKKSLKRRKWHLE